jgi:peptide chain release factor subunit 1
MPWWRAGALGTPGAMRTNQLTDDTLRTLSEVEAAEPVVVSLVLNLDPAQFALPPARSSQITSLLSDLDAAIAGEERSHEAKLSLAADRERLEEFLRDEDLDVDGAGALAVYASDALDLFTAVKLPEPVDADVRVGERPTLEPVMGAQDEGDWCVLLVTRDTARVFRGGPTALREVRGLHSDVKNQHAAGGWSQARFERSVEREVEWHLEAATDLLFKLFKRRPFEHLVIGANNESLRPALADETHAYLTERIRGWVDIDERIAAPDEVLEAVREVMDAHLAAQEQALLERVAAERGTDGRAAAGLDEVLAALVEQRVETLLVREGAEAPGVKCVTCDWLGAAGHSTCPVDETALDELDNVVDAAIQAAIRQSATVHVLRRRDDGSEPEAPFDGPVAALLRY